MSPFLSRAAFLGRTLQTFGLSEELISRELTIIKEKDADILYEVRLDGKWLESALQESDAVLAATDHFGWSEVVDLMSDLYIDALSRATPRKGLFVLGSSDRGLPSPIFAVSEGRRAAVSVDRFLQKVSLAAGREHEGPYKTTLYTSIKEVPFGTVTPMEDPSGYSDTEARHEALRCIQCECMECVKVCPCLTHFGAHPIMEDK